METITMLIIGLGLISLGMILGIISDKFLYVVLVYISIVFMMIGFIMFVIGVGKAGFEHDKKEISRNCFNGLTYDLDILQIPEDKVVYKGKEYKVIDK